MSFSGTSLIRCCYDKSWRKRQTHLDRTKTLLNKHLVSLLIAAEATGTEVGGRKHAARSVDALSVNAIVMQTCDCLTQSELLFSCLTIITPLEAIMNS